jgi:hypothetical protein
MFEEESASKAARASPLVTQLAPALLAALRRSQKWTNSAMDGLNLSFSQVNVVSLLFVAHDPGE